MQSNTMDTRQRDIFIFIVVNVGVVGWTFFLANDKSTTEFLVILGFGFIVMNLALFLGVKWRNRGQLKQKTDVSTKP